MRYVLVRLGMSNASTAMSVSPSRAQVIAVIG